MLNFWKKFREAEQQRKINELLAAQKEFQALYGPDRPPTREEELAQIKESFERGRREDEDHEDDSP